MAGRETTSRTGQFNSGGRKREACDRCHGQKLRCIFPNQDPNLVGSSCVRCAKAGAECASRAPGPVGRPRISQTSSVEEQEGTGIYKRRRKKDGAFYRPDTLDSDGRRGSVTSSAGGWQDTSEETTMNSANSNNMEMKKSIQPASSMPVLDASDDPLRPNPNFPASWPGETLPSFFTEDAGEALNFVVPGFDFSWISHDQQEQRGQGQSSGTSLMQDGSQLDNNGIAAPRVPAQDFSNNTQLPRGSGGLMDIEMSNQNVCRKSSNPMKNSSLQLPRASNQTGKEPEPSLGYGVASTGNFDPFPNVARDKSSAKFDQGSNDVQLQRMQRLSAFAMDLYTQVMSINVHNSQPLSAVSSTTLRDQLIGSVLKSSMAFSTLLDSFSTSTSSSTPSSVPSPTNFPSSINRNNSNSSPSDSGTFSSVSALGSDSARVNETPYLFCSNTSTSSLNDFEKPPTVDITITLQLVICYIHIVHLHSVMYSRLLDYLTAFPIQQSQRPLPVFPGMQAGGVSLDTFGMFQIKLLVQISVHVLGGIEIALGLPQNHRVSTRKNGASRLLDANLSGTFVECLMREKAWRSQNVEVVRKHLRDLRKVLEGAFES